MKHIVSFSKAVDKLFDQDLSKEQTYKQLKKYIKQLYRYEIQGIGNRQINDRTTK